MKNSFYILLLLLFSNCTDNKDTVKVAQSLPAILSEEWLVHGGNYQENRHSELSQINVENVQELALEWVYELGTKRGLEATPLMENGVLYFTGDWSKVYAVDARTGEEIWIYDPAVPKAYGRKACCDVVNRGVALHENKVISGTLDGRLIGLDKTTGKLLWETLTVDQSRDYTITGAPRIVKGQVLIGNGGADYNARGYVSAYDAKTGTLNWRFYTVPGDPSKPYEQPILAEAATTWNGDVYWKYGGGGTVWDAIVYDPELNTVYIGTGNGAPWNAEQRSPGGGDNLFLSSIVALEPETGKYKWHYQVNPGDTWDYTATQPIILADIEIEGSTRKVLMQAPKNGFFYVIDRTNGEFISAAPYTYQNWAKGIDEETGRPIEASYARYNKQAYQDKNIEISPSPVGGHSWQPMAFNPSTGLVYIPTVIRGIAYAHNKNWAYNQRGGIGSGNGWNMAAAFDFSRPTLTDEKKPNRNYGRLIAWNPVEQKMAWAIDHELYWNGGVLSTAGGLVFHGAADGHLRAHDAQTGKVLWEKDLKTGILAPPITYVLDGEQYISLLVGWGGISGMQSKLTETVYSGKLYTFKLNGTGRYPDYPKPPKKEYLKLARNVKPENVATGALLYKQYCAVCHGQPGTGAGSMPDLTMSRESIFNAYTKILKEGALLPLGMPNFGDEIAGEEVEQLKDFIWSVAQSKRN